jgi:hypothetical protein
MKHWRGVMQASDLEVRHQTLFHLMVVGAAFLTYFFQPDDIVWVLVKGHADRALLERIVFGAGTFMIFGAAVFETWARIHIPERLYLGRIIFALGIGLLAPASGTAILLIGESILILRLVARGHQDMSRLSPRLSTNWGDALRQEFSKWGLAFTMIVFTVTLKDRLAEVLAGASFLFWLVLNFPDFLRSIRTSRNA